MMRRRYMVLVGLVIGLALLIAGIWSLAQMPPGWLLAPGATDIRVEMRSLGEQQITYQAPGQPYAWYFTVAHKLAADGWSAPVDERGGLRTRPEIHWRISQFLFVYVSEEVGLQGEPNVARITVRRAIIIPWRRYLP